jgi:hypothetical protein
VKFPKYIPQLEVDHYVKLWKLSGCEVTLYHNDEMVTEHVVGTGELLMFVQTPQSAYEAQVEELYITRDDGYEIFRDEKATKPGTCVPRLTRPFGNQFEVRL